MKKLIVILTGFFLSTGIAFADSSGYDCEGEAKPVTLSANQKS